MPNIFQGKHIRLRAVEIDDWESHFEWDRDTDGGLMTDEVWFPSSAAAARAWTETQAKSGQTDDKFTFQIERLDGVLVGTMSTHTINRRCGTFRYGIFIRPEDRRKGCAREAIGLLLRYFFDERRYQKANVEVFSFNEPSIRLHEGLGFTLEGRLRRMIYSGGQYHDALQFGMTREEFDACGWKPE